MPRLDLRISGGERVLHLPVLAVGHLLLIHLVPSFSVEERRKRQLESCRKRQSEIIHQILCVGDVLVGGSNLPNLKYSRVLNH